MVAELAAAAAAIVMLGAELLHSRRMRRVAVLAFGPRAKPAAWTAAAPPLRAAAAAAVAWGLTTLFLLPPKTHHSTVGPESGEPRHVVMVLDVSPSMRLQDAGPSMEQSRMQRASDVMESFFGRVAIQQYKISVVAVYNGAKPVVVDTHDVEVVRNILSDLPMHYAFPSGKTDLFSGLEEAARVARPWGPRSTTVILISDGDTVPATGMPKMPASVASVLVIGVGDPVTGKFIEGRHSRQDTSTLRQIAIRLRGTYHNANAQHLSSALIQRLSKASAADDVQQLTRREYAIIAAAAGASVLALLPVLLHFLGTRWRPGADLAATARRFGSRTPASQRPGSRESAASNVDRETNPAV